MLERLSLQNFRSYKKDDFKLGPQVNIVVGPNGAGKTNLLEAVLVLTRGKSYRNRLSQLIRQGNSWVRLDADFKNQKRIIKISSEGSEFVFDNKIYRRWPTDQRLPVVLFEPNQLQMITAEPAARREFLDDLSTELDPNYTRTLNRYRRILAQRNHLLRQNPNGIEKQIFVWNVRLAELAGEIAGTRAGLVERINKLINKPYNHLAGNRTPVSLSYASQFPLANYSTKLLSRLNQDLKTEIARGQTTSGPHREDINIKLNRRPIAQAGSRGEIRSIVIALKLLEKDLIEAKFDTKPLLLLDDVFSELDAKRRDALVDYLDGYQAIITTTDADLTRKYFRHQKLIKL